MRLGIETGVVNMSVFLQTKLETHMKMMRMVQLKQRQRAFSAFVHIPMWEFSDSQIPRRSVLAERESKTSRGVHRGPSGKLVQ